MKKSHSFKLNRKAAFATITLVSSAASFIFQKKVIMMQDFYSISDVVAITGLTDRTIRNYISQNVLKGEKADGIWRFSAEQLSNFMNDPNVLPSIRAKKNAIVYDFLADKYASKPEMCLLLDLPGADSQSVSAFFCDAINGSNCKNIRFAFDSLGGQTPRVTLKGDPQQVLALVQRFYETI